MTIATVDQAATVKTYTKQQAFDNSLKAMGDELAAKVLVNKYLLCDQEIYYESTPVEMWDRLAGAIVEAEPTNREYHHKRFRLTLDDFKFVPGGRILYALGNKFAKATLKNCYVIGFEEDSIHGIFQCAERMAETYKAGGGCGIDLSNLRPSGSPIHNAARIASGPVSFMELFSRITGTIGQRARIGALMICMDVSHPDIEEFVKIKGGDDTKLVDKANVSVKVTDEFMQAVEGDKNFDLRWGGKIYRTIRARDLWNLIIEKAWARGEPGLLFWDHTCREVPAHGYTQFRCIATNPCLSGDMRLLTEHGYRTMRELWAQGGFHEYDGMPTIQKHGELKIVNSTGVVSATNVYRTSTDADIFRVTLKNGIKIDATYNHKFILTDGSRVALSELKVGDELPINHQQVFGGYHYPEYAELAGWVIGDGSIAAEMTTMRAKVRTWGADIENALPKLRHDMLKLYAKSNKSTNQDPDYDGRDVTPDGFDTEVKEISSRVLGRLLMEDGLKPGHKHHVPTSIWGADKETVAAFIRGFFSADGSVQISNYKKSISIRNCQVNRSILDECQLLLNQFGITSSVSLRRKACKKLMNDGKGGKKLYNKKAEYEIIISGRCNCERFINEIGFIQEWKPKIGILWLENHKGSNNSTPKRSSKIRSIEYLGKEETFCLTEPEKHEIVANVIMIGQCGEVPLSHGDSCNLGSMNLSKYVLDPFRKSRFDFDGFTHDTKIAVRFLDNVITLEKAPLAFQQKANDDGRRLGLGIMGLADMLAKLQIRFDSDAALDCVNKVMQTFMNASYEASIELAEEKGCFPAFDSETHFESDFIQRLPVNLRDRIKSTGLRNISVNAIAPTGTISLISSCSSGIEPIFMLEHVRKTNLGTAKKVEEHVVRHPCAQLYKNTVGAELPDYFVEAHDINPQYRVKLQGTIQKYIDQSISNTVNLPNDCPKEQVAFYYGEAWRHGCKGITVYRDGCREGVLQAVGSNGSVDVGEIQRHKAPKRPEKLECRVHIIKPNGKSYTVFVGLLKDRPYEVFALDNAMAGLPDGTHGHIVRERSDKSDSDNVYNFEKGALVVRMLNRYEDQEASLVTRLLSTSLRHGVPLEFLVDQMTKSKVSITSTAKAIGRALAAYIDPDEAKGSLKCPTCRSKNIKLEGTCMACHDCGWTRCG